MEYCMSPIHNECKGFYWPSIKIWWPLLIQPLQHTCVTTIYSSLRFQNPNYIYMHVCVYVWVYVAHSLKTFSKLKSRFVVAYPFRRLCKNLCRWSGRMSRLMIMVVYSSVRHGVSTHCSRANCHYLDIFNCIFLNANVWISLKISLKFVTNVLINNGLVPTRRQAIIWTNDVLAYWRIYASLGLNEFKVDHFIWPPLQNTQQGFCFHVIWTEKNTAPIVWPGRAKFE